MACAYKKQFFLLCFVLIMLLSCNGREDITITILQTTDLHGAILPYDYIERCKTDVSLANISGYIKKIRKQRESLILLDGGDIIQGQPLVYYYNFIDTASNHIVSEAMNWLEYDAGTAGNHDIEAGHQVYDRLSEEFNFPWLGANAVNTLTGDPYFIPYVMIRKNNLKIAVLGLITPAIPLWLPEELYKGIEFRDMLETARQWMPEIQKQDPDLIVGLFHSGWDSRDYKKNKPFSENGSASVAYNIPGFDIIFTGHDHNYANEQFVNRKGDTVLILNAGDRAEKIARADITFSSSRINGKQIKKITGSLIDVSDFKPDREFTGRFSHQDHAVKEYVNMIIGSSENTVSTRDSYFGSSSFVDMIHTEQLKLTGADISFAAPFSFDASIEKGDIRVSDMFKLYRYENLLYTINMSGEEIRKYLEFSYSGWLNTMNGPDDYMLNYQINKDGKPLLINGRAWLKNPVYDFDSAAGIEYVVDVRKPKGRRVIIKSMSDGRPFSRQAVYRVAVNSFRGNGGGGHLTRGAGIKAEEIPSRLLCSTRNDMRYLMIESIKKKKNISPVPLNNWKIIPEDWVQIASKKEYRLLFGE
ncbi:MAG TPA: bifunctional UDP-sugar hydrolase/5'-nucleotidase [Bacteroidales bacterium]|nr:bifunctional UDP-sugar hydrolase/5'-nucleotidase [Bacteroidales bacterium]HPR72256.1 bifunctional UDP-sugar hydrolase/5'-nucleotidase [Bacteroidales bacterium]